METPANPNTLGEPPLLLPLPREDWPSVEHLVTEDDTPVDSIFSEKQQRLLTEPLYTSWRPPKPFLAVANVGLFFSVHRPPFVPDVLVSLDVVVPENLFPKAHRSYFVWEYGKPPDLVVEVVSNREGREDTDKLLGYARIGVNYYLIYDPEQKLSKTKLRVYELSTGEYELRNEHASLLTRIGLGFQLWEGVYEGHFNQWLRWTDLNGNLIETGAELAARERTRADSADARADLADARAERLAEQIRRLGLTPEA